MSSAVARLRIAGMRVAIVGKLREIEAFPLCPFPFRDRGTKSERPIRKTNFNLKRAKI